MSERWPGQPANLGEPVEDEVVEEEELDEEPLPEEVRRRGGAAAPRAG